MGTWQSGCTGALGRERGFNLALEADRNCSTQLHRATAKLMRGHVGRKKDLMVVCTALLWPPAVRKGLHLHVWTLSLHIMHCPALSL
eukprot:9658657-Alexandrium_andersonii.AAC.1